VLWDVCVVEKALGTGSKIAARDLLESITQTDKAAWVAVPVEGWANEFFQITRRKFVQYCIHIGTKCVYQHGNETYSEGEEEKVVVVNLAYLEQHALLGTGLLGLIITRRRRSRGLVPNWRLGRVANISAWSRGVAFQASQMALRFP